MLCDSNQVQIGSSKWMTALDMPAFELQPKVPGTGVEPGRSFRAGDINSNREIDREAGKARHSIPA
jgi:hypothetical protein